VKAMDSEETTDVMEDAAVEQTPAEEKRSEQKKPKATPPLAELTEKQVKDLRKWQLLELAEAAGIETAGTKTALIKRLIGKKRGGDKGWVNGHTLCKVCRAVLEAKSTRREGDFIVRQVRCTGRNLHRYTYYTRVPEGENQ